ncbi:MAG: hypothetical protein HUJ51_04280 [Eggerthellaceae bacterium]|nr:hypothetical protein [Eggerthellaceae bacterium]
MAIERSCKRFSGAFPKNIEAGNPLGAGPVSLAEAFGFTPTEIKSTLF